MSLRFALRCLRALVAALVLLPCLLVQAAPKTERQYLSAHGPKDALPWEFSVTAGRRAGVWSTIPVPSNWEQHGFGTYNYGGAPDQPERGLYRMRFAVPGAWKGRPLRLVFFLGPHRVDVHTRPVPYRIGSYNAGSTAVEYGANTSHPRLR